MRGLAGGTKIGAVTSRIFCSLEHPGLTGRTVAVVNGHGVPRLHERADGAPGWAVVGHRRDQLLRVDKGYPIG